MNKTLDEYDDWYPTDAELKTMRPIAEIDPELLLAFQNGTLKPRGRPSIAAKKQAVSIRLDPDVIAAFRATGDGWQSRINDLLRHNMP